MRAGGGKMKGSAFERKICEALSLWVTKGKKKDVFWRSAMSGGRATVHRNKGDDIRQSGDICAVAPEGHVLTDHWFIECKHYRDLSVEAFVFKNKGKLAAFWKKACEQASQHRKQPMLIVKQNHGEVLVLTPDERDSFFISTKNGCSLHQLDCQITLFADLVGSEYA